MSKQYKLETSSGGKFITGTNVLNAIMRATEIEGVVLEQIESVSIVKESMSYASSFTAPTAQTKSIRVLLGRKWSTTFQAGKIYDDLIGVNWVENESMESIVQGSICTFSVIDVGDSEITLDLRKPPFLKYGDLISGYRSINVQRSEWLNKIDYNLHSVDEEDLAGRIYSNPQFELVYEKLQDYVVINNILYGSNLYLVDKYSNLYTLVSVITDHYFAGDGTSTPLLKLTLYDYSNNKFQEIESIDSTSTTLSDGKLSIGGTSYSLVYMGDPTTDTVAKVDYNVSYVEHKDSLTKSFFDSIPEGYGLVNYSNHSNGGNFYHLVSSVVTDTGLGYLTLYDYKKADTAIICIVCEELMNNQVCHPDMDPDDPYLLVKFGLKVHSVG